MSETEIQSEQKDRVRRPYIQMLPWCARVLAIFGALMPVLMFAEDAVVKLHWVKLDAWHLTPKHLAIVESDELLLGCAALATAALFLRVRLAVRIGLAALSVVLYALFTFACAAISMLLTGLPVD
jgi:hypothetical protein